MDCLDVPDLANHQRRVPFPALVVHRQVQCKSCERTIIGMFLEAMTGKLLKSKLWVCIWLISDFQLEEF